MSDPKQHPVLKVTFSDGSAAALPVHTEAVGAIRAHFTPPTEPTDEASAAVRWARDMLVPAEGVSVCLDF